MEQNTKKIKNNILTVLSNVKYIIITTVVLLFLIVFFKDSLIGNVDANEYHIKQAFMTGELSAHLTPGWYLKGMGEIYRFPKTETIYFTKNNMGSSATQGPVSVIFSDNLRCEIAGSVRIVMPEDEQHAIDIVAKYADKTFNDFAVKNIMPVLKSSLINVAATMSVPEAKIRLADIAILGRNQLNYGVFDVEIKKIKEFDPAVGEEVVKEVKNIKTEADGTVVRLKDVMPLSAFGANAESFVVTDIACSPEVEKQISEQQQVKMGIAIAKAKAAYAEQEAIIAKKQGDAILARIKAEEEAKAQQMISAAEREKKLQILNAQKEAEISKLKKQEEENLTDNADDNKQAGEKGK